MKKVASLVLASILALGVMSTSAFADVKTGQKAYLKMFKAKFGMDGTKFAASHTVDEWEALFANDAAGFIKEYSEKFPAAAPILSSPSKPMSSTASAPFCVLRTRGGFGRCLEYRERARVWIVQICPCCSPTPAVLPGIGWSQCFWL